MWWIVRRALRLAALLGILATAQAADARSADQWYALGVQLRSARQYAPATEALQRAAQLNPSAANWRALADTLVQAGQFDGAADAYGRAVRAYRARGDEVTALALEGVAAPYRQEGEVYLLDQPPADPGVRCGRTRAKFEPDRGLYLGLYVDEGGLTPGGHLRAPGELGADLAVYFRYFTLRPARAGAEVFPRRFVAAVKRSGGAAHIALEPGMPLAQVTEATVLPFARAARAAGLPIFLRFASEFNDPANEWSRDPALYRVKFRLVHDVMARVAPNVAMVWMPMPYRLQVIDAYYPGPDAVDWVGLSLYSTPFRNGRAHEPARQVNPLDVLRPIYEKYACTHPIQVSEYGASHRSGAQPGAGFTAFAVEKMRALYWGAFLKYPRLKNINWLNLDMLGNPYVHSPGARRNDYRLLGVPAKVQAFRELLGEPYFRTRVGAGPAGGVPVPFPATLRATGDVRGALWVKTLTPAAVTLTLDGQPVPTGAALPYRFILPARHLSPGRHTLELRAVGAQGHVTLRRVQPFTVRP